MKFYEHFNNFKAILEKINYLENMSETFIYETYTKILLHDSEKVFPEDIP